MRAAVVTPRCGKVLRSVVTLAFVTVFVLPEEPISASSSPPSARDVSRERHLDGKRRLTSGVRERSEACATEGAEAAAGRFFSNLGLLRWEPVADQLHSAALLPFDQVSRDLVGSTQGSRILEELYGVSESEFVAWTARVRFVASMEAMTRYARGLMESQVMTDVTLLGQIPEGPEVCHVVYREATDHMGLVLDGVHVVTLAWEVGEWRVLQNQELDVLATALRGVPIGRVPPGAG